MAENTQHKLNTLRSPRVQITYDVMVGESFEQKELPFVVAIMSDLSGMREKEILPLKDRSFVGIYADNFDDIMAYIQPSLKLSVDNKLLNNHTKFKANLSFNSMDDFNPINLIQQIPALKILHQSRVYLKDLLSKIDGNDELEELLNEIMLDPKRQQALLDELDIELDVGKDKKKKSKVVIEETSLDIATQTLEELPPVTLVEQTIIEENFGSPYLNNLNEDLKKDPIDDLKGGKAESEKVVKTKKDDNFF